jgi:hypothetical protein
MFRHCIIAAAMGGAGAAWADGLDYFEPGQCSLSSTVVNNVLGQLGSVVQSGNGGLFKPNEMWAAVVDRQGVLCGVTRSS